MLNRLTSSLGPFQNLGVPLSQLKAAYPTLPSQIYYPISFNKIPVTHQSMTPLETLPSMPKISFINQRHTSHLNQAFKHHTLISQIFHPQISVSHYNKKLSTIIVVIRDIKLLKVERSNETLGIQNHTLIFSPLIKYCISFQQLPVIPPLLSLGILNPAQVNTC
jgi:hypothetical protein